MKDLGHPEYVWYVLAAHFVLAIVVLNAVREALRRVPRAGGLRLSGRAGAGGASAGGRCGRAGEGAGAVGGGEPAGSGGGSGLIVRSVRTSTALKMPCTWTS